MDNNILEVKNLKVSFRTNNGTVKAVRNISFNLKKGETLAIVGESGSGKSVTSKAIIGILAGNSIVENGEILYDGKDLLKISEEEMCKIRGDKISMIFQDPLSSLDPIVKIGKQITEAMLLKNKLSRKMGRVEFNSILKVLKENMIEATSSQNVDPSEINRLIKTFDKFNIEAIKFENDYNVVYAHAEELLAAIADKLFLISKKQKIDVKDMLSDMAKDLKEIKDPFLTMNFDEEIYGMVAELLAVKAAYVAPATVKGQTVFEVSSEVIDVLDKLENLLMRVISTPRPDFFRIGYYKCKIQEAAIANQDLSKITDAVLRKQMNKYMSRFYQLEKAAIINSYYKSLENKKRLIPLFEELENYFLTTNFTRSEAQKKIADISNFVKYSIDPLQVNKDSFAYTFESSMNAMVDKYFDSLVKNVKEEKRFAKQSAKREAIIARGKSVEWKVIPKVIYDEADLRSQIVVIISRLRKKYEKDVEAAAYQDFDKMTSDLTAFFREKASQVVYRVTKKMAKEKAIKLMEEVGIPEPRTRYNQYPFEFSGGMRQRIVIAIALVANPDILICDEPTTALDVTIQAQILELINKLKEERQLSVIFITHDLGVVANMADRVAVMYAGKIVEQGTAEDVFYDPKHPYTWALLSSMPDLDTNEKLDAIPGTPPNMIYPPEGDAFAARNKYALKIDFEMEPPIFNVSETHTAATWLLHPDAPKVALPKVISDRIARMKEKGGSNNG